MKKETKQAEIDALAFKIMEEFAKENDCVTLEEAQEMARMELNSKQIARYEKSDTPRKKVEKERKVDPNKLALMSIINHAFFEAGIPYTPKTESEFSFRYCGEEFTIKLIKHRKEKNHDPHGKTCCPSD